MVHGLLFIMPRSLLIGFGRRFKFQVIAYNSWSLLIVLGNFASIYEPRREKNGFLHMRKQRRRSASR